MAGKKTPIPFEGKIKIKKGDSIIVLSGKDKGRTGTVAQVLPTEGKVIIEGVNIAIRHTKGQPTQTNPNPEGGRVEKPMPLSVSKVALVNADGKPTRVRTQTNADGVKVRVAVKGGQTIPDPAR
jgi:large subunit ribosomal protein L24